MRQFDEIEMPLDPFQPCFHPIAESVLAGLSSTAVT
jgi:hypothetical protein